MTIEEIVQSREYQSIIADYKDTCLWSATGFEHPTAPVQIDYLLRCIETYGNAEAVKRAGRIRQWL